MRFNHVKGQFPLPILRPAESDSSYVDSDFTLSLSINEGTTPHSFQVEFQLKQNDIAQLLNDSKATISLAIHCDSTYFYDVIDLANTPTQIVNMNRYQFPRHFPAS